MPNVTFTSLDQVPEELHEYAKELENGEGVVLNLVAQDKLHEFRQNNIELAKERDTLKAANTRLTGIVGDNPEEFEKRIIDYQATYQRVQDGELTESTDIEEALTRRTSHMVESYEEQLRREKAETNVYKELATKREAELKKNIIDRTVTDAVLDPRSGARPDALPDILERANKIFRVEDNKVIPKNGDATIYGSDGANPMSALEWLTTDLKSKAGYMFKDSSGGGAGGSQETVPGGATREELSNMSPMERLAYANEHKK